MHPTNSVGLRPKRTAASTKHQAQSYTRFDPILGLSILDLPSMSKTAPSTPRYTASVACIRSTLLLEVRMACINGIEFSFASSHRGCVTRSARFRPVCSIPPLRSLGREREFNVQHYGRFGGESPLDSISLSLFCTGGAPTTCSIDPSDMGCGTGMRIIFQRSITARMLRLYR